MKNTRKLIPAIAMLLVSAIMMSTASYAWFSMNSEVKATGMQVTAKAESSLLIGYTNVPNTNTLNFKTDATAPAGYKTLNSLDPCTYFDQTELTQKTTDPDGEGEQLAPAVIPGADADTAPVPGYFAANNENSWVAGDGGAIAGKQEVYKDAVASTNYMDYIVYIASAGEAISDKALSIKLDIKNPAEETGASNTTIGEWTHKALTFDIVVANVGTGWAGTWEAASAVAGATTKTLVCKDAETATGGVSITEEIFNGTIGTVRTENTVIVAVRVYYDGALQDDNDNYYVQSNNVNTDGLEIDMTFTVA